MSVQDSELAATYSLIHSFLTERSHLKAAEAVKKAAKGVITINGGDQDGPALPVIVKQWKEFMADQGKKATAPVEPARSESSSSESDSDASEDSSSSSEDTSSESDANPEINSRQPKSNQRSKAKGSSKDSGPARPKVGVEFKVKHPSSKPSPSSSTSEGELSSSSNSELDDGETKKTAPGSTLKGTKAWSTTVDILPKSKSGDSSNSDSDSSESEDDTPTPKAADMEVDGTASSQTLPSIEDSDDSDSDAEPSGSSKSEDGSSSASDSDDTSVARKKSVQANGKLQKTKAVKPADTSAIRSPQKLDEPTAVTKRRRTDEAGSSVTTSIIQQPKPSNPHQKGNGKGQPRKTNTPFSRVKVDEIKFADERLKDNTFGSRKATVNDYGTKASADLSVTRGASFRKEKNKKKRGSYRGGDITMESHSIKFTD